MRGTDLRPGNRFEATHLERFDDGWEQAPEDVLLPVVKTEFFADKSKSILASNDSPDLGFRYSINAYRGCEHGCAYCYARPSHEYLGFNAGIDFESKIMVKHDAPALLRKEFDKKSWKPEVIVMSGNTDCYQPAERKYQLTRKLLEVFLDYRNPLGMITKNALILRDLDILKELGKLQLVSVFLSITTLDRDLARKLEPRTSTPERRLEAIRMLSEAGISTGIMIGPVIPGLNDEEIPRILESAANAGADSAGFNMLRLPYAVAPIFTDWLEQNVPMEANKVLSRIGMVRGGHMSSAKFGERMRGTGGYAEFVKEVFKKSRARYGLTERRYAVRTDLFRRAGEFTLFDQ